MAIKSHRFQELFHRDHRYQEDFHRDQEPGSTEIFIAIKTLRIFSSNKPRTAVGAPVAGMLPLPCRACRELPSPVKLQHLALPEREQRELAACRFAGDGKTLRIFSPNKPPTAVGAPVAGTRRGKPPARLLPLSEQPEQRELVACRARWWRARWWRGTACRERHATSTYQPPGMRPHAGGAARWWQAAPGMPGARLQFCRGREREGPGRWSGRR